MIVKKDNRREEFSRDKLSRGLQKACEKRPVSQPSIDQSVIEIHEKANFMAGDTHEINSIKLGEIVMDKLKELDLVAYIRFASVYRDFKDISDFKKEIKEVG